MELNEIKEVTITGIDHYGRGIGKIDGCVIFIPNTLVDEKVKVKITTVKKDYLEGEVIDFLNISEKRITPKCPYFYECGGCDLMHMDYQEQLLFKETKVKEIMQKFAGIDNNLVKEIISSDDLFNYRNKIAFQVKKGKIGFCKKKSYDLVDIDNCLISDEKMNKILKLIKEKIGLYGIEQVIIRSCKNTDDLMIILDINRPIDEEKIIKTLSDIASSIIKKIRNKYTVIVGNDYIIEKLGDLSFIISPSSFFQVNTKQTVKLYNKVLEYAKLTGKEKVLDLYCGTGTIGLYLSRYCKEVLGVEINKNAIKDAFKNKELNNIKNIDFKCGDVSNIIDSINFKPDIIVVDPPRSGLDQYTINQLIKINPEKIIYVSCDPITLARDLNLLKEHYEIKEITPVDMFVNTYHVENVVLLTRL